LGTSATGSQPMTPPLMAAASRLVQMLKLNLRAPPGPSSPSLASHRRRVFWIAYILDRVSEFLLAHWGIMYADGTPSMLQDTSHRYRLMPSLHDSEAEHPIPSAHSDDGLGNIPLGHQVNNMSPMPPPLSYLRLRVQLAQIQGHIVDAKFGYLSRRMTDAEKTVRIAQLEDMLAQWYASLTFACPRESLTGSLMGLALNHVVALYCSHLRCVFMLRDLHQKDAYMIRRLRSMIGDPFRGEGEKLQDNAISSSSSSSSSKSSTSASPPTAVDGQKEQLPVGWESCVLQSRTCLTLVREIAPPEYFIW
jgi:hypothetical protein